MGSRFFLIFALAKLLPPDDIGTYGLLTTITGYSVYVLGMDFYTYANRELIRSNPFMRRTIVHSQIAFELCVYGIALPLLILIFPAGLLPWSMAIWFYLIAIGDHISNEINRTLIALLDQRAASIVLFIRMALVPLIAVPIMILFPSLRTLGILLGTWVVFDVLAILVGIRAINYHLPEESVGSVDWKWISRGIRTCSLFLIGTLCLRFLFTADRQVVHYFDSLAAVAAYTFFMGIANGLGSILDVSLYQFAYPEIVKAIHEEDTKKLKRKMKILTFQAVSLTVIVSSIAVLVAPYVVTWIGGGIYASYEWMLPLLMAAMAIYNLSTVPHYGLYGFGADKAIVKITIIATSSFVAVIAVLLFWRTGAVLSVILGLGSASLVLLVGKTITLLKYIHRFNMTG